MIKGISRQIVEVTDIGNPYFERAFFVVRQQCREASSSLLDHEARCTFKAADGYSGLKHARLLHAMRRWGLFLIGAAIGAACMYGMVVL